MNKLDWRITLCRLDSGETLPYDMCIGDPSIIPDPTHWEFIGQGTICQMDDQPVTNPDRYRFFVQKKP
jgi:hypothetical protein